MANYQELLSRAVEALPENNGASRREVYEKARKALVTQLRGIDPPLPAREITQHRLELEDCIREVEHKATEALLGGLKEAEETSIPLAQEPEPAPEPKKENVRADENNGEDHKDTVPEQVDEEKPSDKKAEPDTDLNKTSDKKAVSESKESGKSEETGSKSGKVKSETDIKDVASAKENDDEREEKIQSDPVQESSEDDNALDAIIARAENAGEKVIPVAKQNEKSDLEIALEGAKGGKKQGQLDKPSRPHSDKSVGAAMSRVREVDNEPDTGGVARASRGGNQRTNAPDPKPNSKLESDLVADLNADGGGGTGVDGNDAQLSVDRAIKALDREAMGVHDNADASSQEISGFGDGLRSDETRFAAESGEEKSSNGLTIFLVLVILLLGAVGGGGYWAWKQGYIDLENLFSSKEVVQDAGREDQSNTNSDGNSGVDEANNVDDAPGGDEDTGPGNTTTTVRDVTLNNSDTVITDDNKSDERLPSDTDVTAADTNSAVSNEDDKSEDRLGADADVPNASLGTEGDVDPENVVSDGPQSLLLEASSDGSGGAVPFSGSVAWSRGLDELGSPTLIGEANIPARNLKVKLLIRKNADASLPASHLMEIEFDVNETFAGGSIAGLPGILLKNEELVQGAALVGASARVVGNSFLFALSSAEQDQRSNLDLLETRKWMDLALIYASGRRAIITLEKDDAAQSMFQDVLAIWNGAEPANAAPDQTVSEGADGAATAVTEATN